ncbi:MAG TPA: response regulator transcription factor [Blastocatellia bacterium]|nr:response regulator transcription factor [Blastocatellia bacterium]
MTNDIRIVVADDHPIVRKGLRQVIEGDPKLKVVAEADDGEAALALIEQWQPDIALLDVDMPKLDGFGVARAIQKKRWAVAVVFLTIHSEEDLFHAAMDLGAQGYILKESALTEIVNGLRAVAAGQHYVSAALTAYLLQRRRRAQAFAEQQASLSDLTPTERRILQMIADSKSSKEIAAELFIHYRTVENHRNNICQKLGLHGPNALLKYALQHKSKL